MVSRHALPLFFLAFVMMLYSVAVQATSVAPKLHSDPFEPPALLLQQEEELVIEVLPETRVWEPELRATMRSPHGAMVNIDGEIIAIGEEINGFRLLEVQERSAIFAKDGQTYPVSLDDAWKKDNIEENTPGLRTAGRR